MNEHDTEREVVEGVILDVTPGDTRFEAGLLEKLGHPVLICHGPGEEVCPLIADGTCELLEAAHGVVFQLDLDRPDHRTILDRYQKVLDVPIRAVVKPGQDVTYADLLTGVQVWTHEPTAGDLDGFAAQVETSDRFAAEEAASGD